MQRELLSLYLSKYDDMIERRQIDEEIDLLTGIVKPNRNAQNPEDQGPKRDSFLFAHNEELKFEMQTLRNQPIQSTLGAHQLQDLRNTVSENSRRYIRDMVKYSIFQQYYEAKARLEVKE